MDLRWQDDAALKPKVGDRTADGRWYYVEDPYPGWMPTWRGIAKDALPELSLRGLVFACAVLALHFAGIV